MAEREREVEERRHEDVSVAGSLARCPFCHDEVAPGAADWVACESCLARHHETCWNESACCATCQGTRFLARRDREAIPRHNRAVHAILGYMTLGFFPIVMAEIALAKHLREHTPSLQRAVLPARARLCAPLLLFALGFGLLMAFASHPDVHQAPPVEAGFERMLVVFVAILHLVAVLPVVTYLHIFRETVRRHERAALPGSEERVAASWRRRRIVDLVISLAGLVPLYGLFAVFAASARVCGALTLHAEHEGAPERAPRAAPVKDPA